MVVFLTDAAAAALPACCALATRMTLLVCGKLSHPTWRCAPTDMVPASSHRYYYYYYKDVTRRLQCKHVSAENHRNFLIVRLNANMAHEHGYSVHTTVHCCANMAHEHGYSVHTTVHCCAMLFFSTAHEHRPCSGACPHRVQAPCSQVVCSRPVCTGL